MIEVWKDVPDYEGLYKVSNLGNVKSLDRSVKHYKGGTSKRKGKLLSSRINTSGYYDVILSNGKTRVVKNSVLVAMAFLNHNPCGMKLVVDHIDGCKTNDKLDNLQVITTRENTSRCRLNKTSKYVGVSRYKNYNKWISQIQFGKKKIHLGLFNTEIEAHQAYKKALIKLSESNGK